MRYSHAGGLRAALDTRLLQQARSAGLNLDRLQKMVMFERLLARLVLIAPERWVLKGGVALNCRLGSMRRATKDIDLAHRQPLDVVVQDLRQAQDLVLDPDDFFRFRISRSADRIAADWSQAVRYHVDVDLAGRVWQSAVIDIEIDETPILMTDQVQFPHLLEFTGLPPTQISVLPLEHHIADKLHAYLRGHVDRRRLSSREKDLLDIVLIGQMCVRAGDLRLALARVFGSTALPERLPKPPPGWGPQYRQMAADVGLEARDVRQALVDAQELLDPILDGRAPNDAVWNPQTRSWSAQPVAVPA